MYLLTYHPVFVRSPLPRDLRGFLPLPATPLVADNIEHAKMHGLEEAQDNDPQLSDVSYKCDVCKPAGVGCQSCSRLTPRVEERGQELPLFRRADYLMMPEAKTCGEHHCNSRGLANCSASQTRHVLSSRQLTIISDPGSHCYSGFQSFGQPLTGHLTLKTTILMQRPRCGIRLVLRDCLSGKYRRKASNASKQGASCAGSEGVNGNGKHSRNT